MLSLVFGPDTVSTANMMTDLARGLQEHGHEVTVLTSMPHYNPTESVMANPAYRARLPRLYTENIEHGSRILRIYMPLKRNRIWRRALDYLWFHVITTLVAATKVPRQDVIFVPSPPITLGFSGYLVCLLLRARLIYDVRELWPDVPVRMGMIKNRLLLQLVYKLEDFVYKRSVAITSIARSFNESLMKRGVPKEKMHFTPNFVDVNWLNPCDKQNSFAREHGLTDKFVAFYAGNIGLTQGLEILVDVAKQLKDLPDLLIVIVGDGAGRAKLERAINEAGLSNMRLLPFQPYERVPETYGTADVCLSPMMFGFSYDTVPSKIYTAMAAARPVISACESDTESAQLLTESHGGLVVTPESSTEMAAAVRKLYGARELKEEMGRNARQWIVAHYSKDAVISTYDFVIRDAVAAAA